MKIAIVYDTKTGNTQQVAQAIRQVAGEQCIYFGEPDVEAVADAQLVFVGFWTDKGDCPPPIQLFLRTLENKRVALFGTAGYGGEGSYFDAILDRVKHHMSPSCTAVDGFMCQGRMPASVRQRYETMLEAEPENPKYRELMENFDLALPHPTQEDLLGAGAFAEGLLK